MKKLLGIFIAVILVICTVTLVGCDSATNTTNNTNPVFNNPGDNLGGGGEGTTPTEEVVIDTDELDFSDDLDDLSNDTDSTGATPIASCTDVVTISTDGSYILQGDYKSGLVISVADKKTTHIYLNGANISNSDGIAISNTNKKSTLIITAIDGTTNTISNDGDDVNAIHVKGTLQVNGTGTISVASSSKNGIKVSKGLEIVDTKLNVTSNNNAVAARYILAENAEISVYTNPKDGLNAECDDETTEFPDDYSEGFVKLINTKYTCDVYGDGIQADTLIYIEGGDIDITTHPEFASYSAANKTEYELINDDFKYTYSNGTYTRIASDSNVALSRRYALTQSCKGLKVGEISYEDGDGNEIDVTDGDYLLCITGDVTMDINSGDDAIHTNSGNVVILNGTITINTTDDGITSDYLTEIVGGTITIESSYEGIEGAYVKITGGTITITSSDDGINAASDLTSITEYILITGGDITVTAAGDGIDSNGSTLISGGSLTVYGPTSGADSGLDSETGILVNGGTVFVTSTLGMVETPAKNSTQYVLSFAQNTTINAGVVITIANSKNQEVFSGTIGKACQSIIISTPNFGLNESYTIYGNDTTLGTFTISSIITSVGSANNISNNGPGGGPGRNFDPFRR